MNNAEVAAVFDEIADILEIQGANAFRVRSYRNAARAVSGLPEPVARVYERGGLEALEAIPGIGKALALKIEELIKTGQSHFHQELRSQLPAGVLHLMDVPGVGPRSAKLFMEQLQVTSVEDLERAAQAGRVRELPRMGAKSEQRLLENIATWRGSRGRFTLAVAVPLADSIAAAVRAVPGVEALEVCGSLRRRKETVGDLDFLAVCSEPGPAMDAFTTHEQVERVVARGDTKSNVVLKAGIEADLRVLPRASYGAAMQYFTGSQPHNVALRHLARQMGLTINEYGVYRERDMLKVAGETEEDVYAAVGLPWITPELRENRGEIEAARKGKLPRLLEERDIKGDLHAHTLDSDGVHTLAQMVEAARACGYSYIAVTNHSESLGVARGLDETRLRAESEAIDALNARLSGFRVLKGSEVDILGDGSLDWPDEVLTRLDIVVASVHSHFNQDQETMTRRIIRAMRNPHVDIIAHLSGRILGQRPPYQVDLEAVLQAARETGTWLELNASPYRLDLDDVHCQRARELGVGIVISTDAHGMAFFSEMHYGVSTARRGWLEARHVRNCLDWPELLAARKDGS